MSAVSTIGMAAGMAAAPAAPAVPSRSAVVRCERCGVSRPAGHAYCYACGRLLGARGRQGPGWGGVVRTAERAWAGLSGLTWLPRRKPPLAAQTPISSQVQLMPLPVRPMRLPEARTFTDRAARWYVGLTVVAVGMWLGTGQAVTVPAACAPVSSGAQAPSEACAWVDAQRTVVQREVGKVADAQRPVVAQRLAELAALVGSSGAAG